MNLSSCLFNCLMYFCSSVDRKLLLRFVHSCAAPGAQQRETFDLLRTVQHKLDLSCSSCVDLNHSETLRLTAEDCRAVSILLRCSSRDTQLILQDCEVEDSGLDLLFPVLYRVRLRWERPQNDRNQRRSLFSCFCILKVCSVSPVQVQ